MALHRLGLWEYSIQHKVKNKIQNESSILISKCENALSYTYLVIKVLLLQQLFRHLHEDFCRSFCFVRRQLYLQHSTYNPSLKHCPAVISSVKIRNIQRFMTFNCITRPVLTNYCCFDLILTKTASFYKPSVNANTAQFT